jgi:large subunit ribosomal protein L21
VVFKKYNKKIKNLTRSKIFDFTKKYLVLFNIVNIMLFKFMKYAIVEISGRQFWIETGKYYDMNRIPTAIGKEVTLNRVLLVNNEGELLVGKPYLDTVKVQGKILEHLRGQKTIVYKMRPKKKTRKKQGHRQELTRVLIENININ